MIKCIAFDTNEQKTKTTKTLSFNSTIELHNISFKYDLSNKLALENICLQIPRRSSIGIVGPSGSGKTTLIDIILGLLETTEGEVRIDGENIAQNLSSWQKQIGYIPQHIYLSDDTIRCNVAFGIAEEKINDDMVWDALRMAQLDDFVKKLPEELETRVGERGARLSGGQRQRIGIARALFHNPALLIMDEATASLDNETERAFIQAIEKLSDEKTMIVIAHRLSTVENCNKILLLKDGKLMALGTYDELLGSNSDFQKMAGFVS